MSIVLKIVAVVLWLVTIADLPRLLAALRSGSPAYIAGSATGMLLLTLLGYALYKAAVRMEEKAKLRSGWVSQLYLCRGKVFISDTLCAKYLK